MARTSLENLVEEATYGRIARASTWRAERMTPLSGRVDVEVWHYDTKMISLQRRDGEWYAFPCSKGWGSVSDKQGVGKILRGVGCVNANSYNELHDGQ